MAKKWGYTEKKDTWNERFWIGTIPRYRVAQDPRSKIYLGARWKSRIASSIKNRKPESKLKSHDWGTTAGGEFNRLTDQLELLCREKLIPEPQSIAFQTAVLALPRIQGAKAMTKEIQELQQERSAVQIALKSIAAREVTLQIIVELNEQLMKVDYWEGSEEVKIECVELINTYCLLSLSAVESIQK